MAKWKSFNFVYNLLMLCKTCLWKATHSLHFFVLSAAVVHSILAACKRQPCKATDGSRCHQVPVVVAGPSFGLKHQNRCCKNCTCLTEVKSVLPKKNWHLISLKNIIPCGLCGITAQEPQNQRYLCQIQKVLPQWRWVARFSFQLSTSGGAFTGVRPERDLIFTLEDSTEWLIVAVLGWWVAISGRKKKNKWKGDVWCREW